MCFYFSANETSMVLSFRRSLLKYLKVSDDFSTAIILDKYLHDKQGNGMRECFIMTDP